MNTLKKKKSGKSVIHFRSQPLTDISISLIYIIFIIDVGKVLITL